MSNAMWIGYHGTSVERAASIVREGFSEPQDCGYLGRGTYFFQETSFTNGPKEARYFVEKCRPELRPVAVVMSEIDPADVLDLAKDEDARRKFMECRSRAWWLHSQSVHKGTGFEDSAVFLLIYRTVNPKLVRALVEGTREHLYPSYIVRRPQLTICVRDRSCIGRTVRQIEVD